MPESIFQTRSSTPSEQELKFGSHLLCASARQNFDGDAVASSRNFNDAMARSRWFRTSISVRMEY